MNKIPGVSKDLRRGFADAEGELGERFMSISTERELLKRQLKEIKEKLRQSNLTDAKKATLGCHYQGKCARLKKLKEKAGKHADMNYLIVSYLKRAVTQETFSLAVKKARKDREKILGNVSGWEDE